MKNVRVLLIGDEDRRSEVKESLRSRRDVELAGEIGESKALRLVPEVDPDVIVLDFAAEWLNALATLPWLHKLPGNPMLVVLGASGTAIEKGLALELGASAYAAPGASPAVLDALIAPPVELPRAA